MPGSRKFTQLPLLQAQSSVWNRLSFLNTSLMFLHKLNKIVRTNWTWISDCLTSVDIYRKHWNFTLCPSSRVASIVGFRSGFNVKLLHDWSNFDLPKLMPVEHIFLMPSSCFSLTLIHARIHANKLLITAQPIRNLRTPASAEMNKRGFLEQASLPLSPQPPSLFSFLHIPYPFRNLLRRLIFDINRVK